MFHVKHLAPDSPGQRDILAAVEPFSDLGSTQASRICRLAERAERLSQAAGLTGPAVARAFLQAHLLPALAAWRLIRPHPWARIADLGAGAGAFALTAALLHPGTTVAAIDSSRRHCEFIANTAQQLDIANLTTLDQRAEVLAEQPDTRHSFDIVGCRALAPDDRPYELARPLLRPGGALLLWRTCGIRIEGSPDCFRVSRQLDLSQFSPRLTLTRYDLACSV